MSSPNDQINIPCADSNPHLIGSPNASSTQENRYLPGLLGCFVALFTFLKTLILGSENGNSTPAFIPSSTFDLMSLAGELRNKIYAEALASGTISILLLSKEIYAEAKPIIYKVGVLKLGRDQVSFGENSFNARLSPAFSEEKLSLIQNINIDIEQGLLYRSDLNDANLSWYSWAAVITPSMVNARLRGIMGPFMNPASVGPRGTCEVILRDFDKLERGKQQIIPVFAALKYFANFNRVILTVTANRGRDNWVGWLDQARRVCMEELHGSLGPATWHPENETFDDANHSDGYLVFHPRGSGTKAEGELVRG